MAKITFLNFKIYIVFLSLINNTAYSRYINRLINSNCNLNLVAVAQYADGLARLSINFISDFKDKIKINFIATHLDPNYIEPEIMTIINRKNKIPANISLFIDNPHSYRVMHMPNSFINIALSVFETTEIPQEWVENLNKYFDLVIVPDEFLVKVYQDSGVNLPIFSLPHIMHLNEHLSKPAKTKANEPFVFGCSALFVDKKNHKLLVKAFLSKFENNPNVKLKLHTRFLHKATFDKVEKILKKHNSSNIEIINKVFSFKEHLDFLRSLDCYVLLSKGEGFSLTPREAIALAIPTILSNNTAHKTLCDSGYFISVNSQIAVPADYRWYDGQYHGYYFDCNLKDAQDALSLVYNNYDYYLNKAKEGREWVKKYLYENLEKKYLNLFKPKKIIFADKNIITDDCLITNSKKLYRKYLRLIKFQNKKYHLNKLINKLKKKAP